MKKNEFLIKHTQYEVYSFFFFFILTVLMGIVTFAMHLLGMVVLNEYTISFAVLSVSMIFVTLYHFVNIGWKTAELIEDYNRIRNEFED